ncbi:hypothetical protein [Vibrio jasicida]|uniref:hypothetical protein n=1 Tax=Vibrio jasicida TaxID=766224 RepID=UPI0005EF56E7|nr:hypothetical protein [Vibrio jasicida]
MSLEIDSKLLALKNYLTPTKHKRSFDLPVSGQISMSDIREVLGLSGEVSLRAMADIAGLKAGEVALSDFYGYTPCDGLNYQMEVGNKGRWVGYADGSDPDVGEFGRLNCIDFAADKTILSIRCYEETPSVFTFGYMTLDSDIGYGDNILLTPTSGSEISPWTFIRNGGGTYSLSGGSFGVQRFGDWLNENINRSFTLKVN